MRGQPPAGQGREGEGRILGMGGRGRPGHKGGAGRTEGLRGRMVSGAWCGAFAKWPQVDGKQSAAQSSAGDEIKYTLLLCSTSGAEDILLRLGAFGAETKPQ